VPAGGISSPGTRIAPLLSTIFEKREEGHDGAQGQSRTAYTRIFSPLLYQLSYLGVGRSSNTC
jgi:hypothetical protein